MESYRGGFEVGWPTGIGVPDNQGVANAVKGSPNTLGYVDLNYAVTTGIPYALIKNSAGKYIAPSLDSTQQAVINAPVAKSLPEGDQSWTKVTLLNSPGSGTHASKLHIPASTQRYEHQS
jgi:ABC-type phosphate transport system substrate-binding protein